MAKCINNNIIPLTLSNSLIIYKYIVCRLNHIMMWSIPHIRDTREPRQRCRRATLSTSLFLLDASLAASWCMGRHRRTARVLSQFAFCTQFTHYSALAIPLAILLWHFSDKVWRRHFNKTCFQFSKYKHKSVLNSSIGYSLHESSTNSWQSYERLIKLHTKT